VSLLAKARPVLRVGIGVTLLGFALMFFWPAVGAWIAVPGMAIVVACGLLAFGVLLASFCGWRLKGGVARD